MGGFSTLCVSTHNPCVAQGSTVHTYIYVCIHICIHINIYMMYILYICNCYIISNVEMLNPVSCKKNLMVLYSSGYRIL